MDKAAGTLLIIALIVMGVYYTFIAIVVCVLVCVVCYGLYWGIQQLYVGKVHNKEADPLFTNIAKWIVRDETHQRHLTTKLIANEFSIEDARANYILQQLDCANIIKGRKAVCKNYWSLGAIFHKINSDTGFFTHCLNDKMDFLDRELYALIHNSITKEFVSILTAFKNVLPGVMQIEFFERKREVMSNYASSEELNSLDQQLYQLKQKFGKESIDIQVNSSIAQSYQDLCDSIERTSHLKVRSHLYSPVNITTENIFPVKINGVKSTTPCVQIGTYKFYFFPTFVIEFADRINPIIKFIERKNIKVEITKTYTTEKKDWFEEEKVPISSSTYLHTCLDGTPDLRYKDNPRIYYYALHKIEFKGLDLCLVSGQNGFHAWKKYFMDIAKPNNTYKSETKNIKTQQEKIAPVSTVMSDVEEALQERIIKVISDAHVDYNITATRSFVSILNDYNVFQSVDEMAYPRILKAAIDAGVLIKIMNLGVTSAESISTIQRFITSSGYDANKTTYIMTCVYNAFMNHNSR